MKYSSFTDFRVCCNVAMMSFYNRIDSRKPKPASFLFCCKIGFENFWDMSLFYSNTLILNGYFYVFSWVIPGTGDSGDSLLNYAYYIRVN
jgi:hypothetical protein